MNDRTKILSRVMRETVTSQTELARLSGIHQPSISQFLHGRIDMSDEQLTRLLACMGYELKVTRSTTAAPMTKQEFRSWILHRAIASRLTEATIVEWRSAIRDNLTRLRASTQGEPHTRNIDWWSKALQAADATALRRALTGVDRSSIELREVSPFAGVLDEEERRSLLAGTR